MSKMMKIELSRAEVFSEVEKAAQVGVRWKRWVVVSQRRDGDYFCNYPAEQTEEGAKELADYLVNHLTKSEQERTEIWVEFGEEATDDDLYPIDPKQAYKIL